MIPTGTVTFLFTDIQGSTQLWQTQPKGMPLALQRHHAILRQAIETNQGYVFQIIGDAFCAAFPTAVQGLQAALDAQRLLQGEPWELLLGDSSHIRVRMALHSGSAEVRFGEYTSGEYVSGLTLSRAARLLSAGHGGQVLLSLPAVELVRDHLPDSVNLLDLGERRLKDLIRPEHIFQLQAPDLPHDFPPLKTLDRYRHNLPLQNTSFIGREIDLAKVRQILTSQRLLTLTGIGGTGKTRLALQAAADLLDEFPHGVWFIDLAPLSDPSLVAETAASVFSLRPEAHQSYEDALSAFVQEKRLLLILDNCEHLVDACARLVDALLKAGALLCILATSRSALGVYGEATYPVMPLSAPDQHKHHPPAALTQFEAVRLFIERAAALQPGFTVTNQNAPAIAQICSQLDGIPLALELAAARIKVLPVEAIAARLDDRFSLLTRGSRTALPRQQTLRAMMDWSYELLSEQERLLLQRLAVFAGGWTLEAAEAVAASSQQSEIDPYEVLDLLERLVTHSLIGMQAEQDGRFHMLETIRQYASEKLHESGQAVGLRDAHLRYLHSLILKAEPYLFGAQDAEWKAHLDREAVNLRSALEWAFINIEQGSIWHLEVALSFCGALWMYWFSRGEFVEGSRWCDLTLEAAQPLGIDSQDLRKTLNSATAFAVFRSDLNKGLSLARACLIASRQVGDHFGEAISLHHIGVAMINSGDLSQGQVNLEEGLVIARQTGNLWLTTVLITDLANLYMARGELELAYASFREDLEVSEQLGNQFSLAYALGNMAWVLIDLDRLSEARDYLQRSLQVSRTIGEKRMTASNLTLMAKIAAREGKPGLAAEYLVESLELLYETGDRQASLEVIWDISENACQIGNWDYAARLAAAVLAGRSRLGLTLQPVEMPRVEALRAALQEQLNAQAFQQAWEKGSSLSFEQAVQLAQLAVSEANQSSAS